MARDTFRKGRDMKKLLIFALGLMLCLAMLTGCGGDDAATVDAGDDAAVESNGTTDDSDAGTSVQLGSLDDAIAKYGIDLTELSEMGPHQPMSSTRLSRDELLKAYEELSKPERKDISYEEMVTIVGAEPSQVQMSHQYPHFIWISAEDDYENIGVIMRNEAGKLVLNVTSKTIF
jgi:hypothetical protein